MGVTGRLAAGELGGQRPPDGYGRVEFLLGQETLADLKEDSWHSWVERILSDELAPSRAPRDIEPGSDGRRRPEAGCRECRRASESGDRWERWPGIPSRRRWPR